MRLPFLLSYKRAQDYFFIQQLYALELWVQKVLPSEPVLIRVETQSVTKNIRFSGVGREAQPDFLFCDHTSRKKYQDNSLLTRLFDHEDYSIYMRKGVFEKQDSRLLEPYSLTISEKRMILVYAREVLASCIIQESLVPEEQATKEEGFFSRVAHIDITLWLDGKFRGSHIIFGRPLKESVLLAVEKAYNDERFVPLTKEDLSSVRIEVVIVYDLPMPLREKEIRQGGIVYDKAYSAGVLPKEGWFLPNVFNIRYFGSLQAFLSALSLEKIGQKFTPALLRTVSMYQTEIFIENERKDDVVPLCGPLLEESPFISKEVFETTFFDALEESVEYLFRKQLPSGAFPVIYNTYTGESVYDDLPRFAFTLYALCSYAPFSKKTPIQAKMAYILVERGLQFLIAKLEEVRVTHSTTSYTYILALIYGARTFLQRNEKEKAESFVQEIKTFFSQVGDYEPILYSQYALLLLELELYKEGSAIVAYIHQDFLDKEKRGSSINLPLYAELPYLLILCSREEKSLPLQKEGERIASWYYKHQQDNGSFITEKEIDYVYLRGTGKIIEVLSKLGRDHYLVKSIRWCLSLRYSRETIYHVQKSIQKEVLGGFRHDYFDKTIWSDGIGHLLLAYVHLQKQNITAGEQI